ncbi:MAG: hypothetical protein HKN45_08770 [Flavobacteriales bacterium]|nr:hypothetical protein [Flavobacteriales bacterium]
MSTLSSDLIDSIKRKIKEIHSKNIQLEQRVLDFGTKLEEKDTELLELQKEVSRKAGEIETLKLAKAYQEGDMADPEAKAKINEMVKEIDRCIALLNN